MGHLPFEPRTLDLIGKMASGTLRRVVLTKRGRPDAALVALNEQSEELWGGPAEIMGPFEGIDLTAQIGEVWKAARE